MPKKYRTQVDPDKLIVDRNTGEVLGVHAKRVCETQEEFVKVYLNSLDELVKLDNRMFQVLMVCLKKARYVAKDDPSGNTFNNDADFKEECRSAIDKELTNLAINVYVSRLCAADMILRKSRGLFMLNPRYFAKGNITPDTRMELIVTYEGGKGGK